MMFWLGGFCEETDLSRICSFSFVSWPEVCLKAAFYRLPAALNTSN